MLGHLLRMLRRDPRQNHLYIPKDIFFGHYTVEMSQEKGEAELVRISQRADREYQWIFYPDPNRWVFYPQMSQEKIQGSEYLRLSTQLFPLITKNLHKVGAPFPYHLHPKAAFDFIYHGIREQASLGKREARNFAAVCIMFPSGGNLESCDEHWRISDYQQQRVFGIASPFGVTKVELFGSDSEFFQQYESLRNTNVLERAGKRIMQERDLEILMAEMISEHRRAFDGLLSVEFTRASTYGA